MNVHGAPQRPHLSKQAGLLATPDTRDKRPSRHFNSSRTSELAPPPHTVKICLFIGRQARSSYLSRATREYRGSRSHKWMPTVETSPTQPAPNNHVNTSRRIKHTSNNNNNNSKTFATRSKSPSSKVHQAQ